MTSVLIVEDQRMPRENMEHLVEDSGRYRRVASLSTAEMALAQCARHTVDLVLMDVCTKGSRDGIDVAAEIKARHPETKVIIITSMVEESYLKRAKAAGAESFWYKDVSPESLLEVMDRTMAGESLYPDRTPETRLGQVSSTQLTPREIEVLRLVCEGLEYEEIAAELGISSRDLAAQIPGAVYCSTLEQVTEELARLAQPGDMIITVGAGDIYRAGEMLLNRGDAE